MKRFVFIAFMALSVFLCSCKAEEPFVFSKDNVNSVLSDNQLPFVIDDVDDVDNSQDVDQYICSLNSADSEKVFCGSFGYTTSTDGRKRVVVTPLGLKPEQMASVVNALSEIMDIKTGNKIYDIISEKFAAGEYDAFGDIAAEMEFEHDSYYVKAQLDKDSTQPVLLSLIIENDIHHQWVVQENERMRRELLEKYPLYYSQEPFDAKPRPTLEDINLLLAAEKMPFTVKDADSETSDLGLISHTYELYNEEEWIAHVNIRQFVSGQYVSFMYMTTSDFYKQSDAGSYPVRVAAAAFGGVDDVKGLEQKVNAFIAREYTSYAQERYIKHGDVYCEVTTLDDYTTKEEYLFSITLYEPDALKAELTLTMDTSENDKRVYDKFFG